MLFLLPEGPPEQLIGLRFEEVDLGYCYPEFNFKALQTEVVIGPDGEVQSYTCKCLACGYYYSFDGRESEGKDIHGELPDCVRGKLSDLGYAFRRVVTNYDRVNLQYLPCKLDDPRRSDWAIFSVNADGSLKRKLFGQRPVGRDQCSSRSLL